MRLSGTVDVRVVAREVQLMDVFVQSNVWCEDEFAAVGIVERPDQLVNRLGVKWFERAYALSSSWKIFDLPNDLEALGLFRL